MRVGLDQAGHDRRAGAVDHLVAGLGGRPPTGADALDPVTPDHDVGGHRRGAGAVEDLPVDEEDSVHWGLPGR